MTKRIKVEKWILYRHTNNLKLLCQVGIFLRNYSSFIDGKSKENLLLKLKLAGLYNERNKTLPLDAINHKINQLAYFMFGYKAEDRFLFSPLGNLFFKNIGDATKRKKIFLAMLWSHQYPHPHSGTDPEFNLFPFRLIFKLLLDERLDCKLYAYEVAMRVVFVKNLNSENYEKIISEILSLRSLEREKLVDLLKKDEHAYVNSSYEWDYYLSKLFEDAGVIDIEAGEVICNLNHGKSTKRKVTKNITSVNREVRDFLQVLIKNYPAEQKPLSLKDPERMQLDVVKEIYSFYPTELLHEIGEINKNIEDILKLPKMIEQYSNNNEGIEAYLFEDVLTEGFNIFSNVQARKIGGAGNADIECLYLPKSIKFSVDAKSTKNKLISLNAGRLESHMRKIGGLYTIVITPRYVPAVKNDILGRKIVLILASTFSEYLYNNIINNVRDVNFEEINQIIEENPGSDISPLISNITTSKFGKVSSFSLD